MRFVKLDPASPAHASARGQLSFKIANRCDLHEPAAEPGSPADLRLNSRGDFLSRLWALFDEPTQVMFEGFVYWLRDDETGLTFSAYAAGSGPAYGGSFKHAAGKQMLRAFEELVASTPPADCVIRYKTDFGLTESGARDGVPFDRAVAKKRRT